MIFQDTNPEEAQVVVTYRQPSELSAVQVSSTTYVLHQAEDVLGRNPELDHGCLSFRTPWDGCLARVYGSAFSDLVEPPIILENLYGSIARIYRGLALGERNVGKFSRKTYINFAEPSYGEGFIDSIISIFPELKAVSGLFDQMQSAMNTSLEGALEKTERAVLSLAQLCKCSQCTRSGIKSEACCRLVVGLSIRLIASTISCTIRDEGLLPTVRGIRHVYGRTARYLMCAMFTKDIPLLSVALDLPMEGMVENFTELRRWFDPLSYPM